MRDLTSVFGVSNTDQMIVIANLLADQGKREQAEQLYLEVLEEVPDHPIAKQGLEKLIIVKIPEWHFDMLADPLRNEAFDKAIQNAVQEGDQVLDIGTGSGLLAMMAARSGAGSVLACEVNPDIAKAAEKVVLANGYQDKIEVVAKRSDLLVEGEDYQEKFDVIVSEILDSGGLGEGVIPSLRHAKKNLAKPNARIIPSGISLKARLVEVPRLSKVNPVNDISGFDLSHFDEFRVSDIYKLIDINQELNTFLSDEFSLRSYDFYNIPDKEVSFKDPEIESYSVECTENGSVHAVLFWFDLHMDETASYSSGPGGELIHWQQAIFYFDKPASVQKGQRIDINALYSDWLIRFRLP